VTIYVCGVTPYDTTHVGHLFTFATFDVLVRYLRYLGYAVTYVQNITDVDDDMFRKARELGTTWDALADEQVKQLVDDMTDLNIAMPDQFPKASDQIPMIQSMVTELLRLGRAYVANGNVYYDVRDDADFGAPAHLSGYDEMLRIANERGNTPDDANKRDPLDFVLWQAAAPDEPSWDSPWGGGRPGWHIECSAMTYRYLGATVDIHGGGFDLVFPHHACERVQSERFTGVRPFVRFWLHVGMVRLGGEKMSKSLGNLVLARDLLRTWPGNAIRLALANHHYREEWDWEQAELERMAEWSGLLQQALDRPVRGTERSAIPAHLLRDQIREALDDDFNTPRALQALVALATTIRAAPEDADVREAQQVLQDLARLFGLRLATKAEGH